MTVLTSRQEDSPSRLTPDIPLHSQLKNFTSVDAVRWSASKIDPRMTDDCTACPGVTLWGVLRVFARRFPSLQYFGGVSRSEVFDHQHPILLCRSCGRRSLDPAFGLQRSGEKVQT